MDSSEKRPDYRKTKKYKALRKNMLASLDLRGLDSEIYTDKVEEYMDLWCVFQMAKADVEKNGVFLFDDRGRRMKNDSANLVNQVSRQMLSIFNAMGFKPDESGIPYDDDDL